MSLGPLHAATRDLHHACEQHVVGAAMASGSPPVQWYMGWLCALKAIHGVTDAGLPPAIDRRSLLQQDISALEAKGVPSRQIRAADEYAIDLAFDPLLGSKKIDATTYVLIGAHLFGGEIMRRRLQGLPTAHLTWEDRAAAIEWFKPLRQREELADEARTCFYVLLKCMDEIAEGRAND